MTSHKIFWRENHHVSKKLWREKRRYMGVVSLLITSSHNLVCFVMSTSLGRVVLMRLARLCPSRYDEFVCLDRRSMCDIV